ncbi:MAG TPA: TIGR02266 family protein [Kofleriaceae bacterium]|nr:TIGR02266 family protein [Kofleriaceae bacterium]
MAKKNKGDKGGGKPFAKTPSATAAEEMSTKDKTADAERRTTTRRPIELKVEYKRLNTFFADYTKNISRGGTFIKTGRPLPVGTEFLFKLFVPGRAEPLTIHGEVQRIVTDTDVDGDGTPDQGMAIRFVYREGDPQAEIARVVEGLMTESLGARLYAKLMEVSQKRSGD